ncbi:MAG: outer membrane protein transport protein [Prevotella sp.]|nr:outer membrane protein transport protein [Bacteroides sp.]MCM1365629.1 outer membrane protein transport protein [Prevotella sp.]
MKKSLLIASSLLLMPGLLKAQSAFDGYKIAENDLKGTARFMSMAGSFGALGGDLSTLSQNPGGIGVYRSSELGFTLDLDIQNVTSKSLGSSTSQDQTKFLLNNIGGVATFRMNSTTCPNINIGFTYNKAVSFNRAYKGTIPTLHNSLSNYIAGVTEMYGPSLSGIQSGTAYDPYTNSAIPWISILGYDSYLISPVGDESRPDWVGQWSDGTSGSGNFVTSEKGSVDEYNISFGGNFGNVVSWGMTFGIMDINYTSETRWAESLDNAWVSNPSDQIMQTRANWNLYNYYNLSGSGFNYKLGFIVKPIQELRLGFAFHTPTWYSLDQYFYGEVNYDYNNGIRPGYASTNNGYDGYSDFNFRTPWHLIFSAAGVIGNNLIVSANYEWEPTHAIHFKDPYSDGYFDSDSYYETNLDAKDYFRSTNIFSIGAEYRVTPQFSVRAGYRYVSSPTKPELTENKLNVYTAGTRPQYQLDDATNYITFGLGYKYQKFYADLAYVYKHKKASYHAYTPDPSEPTIPSPQADLSLNNNQIVLSLGFKF